MEISRYLIRYSRTQNLFAVGQISSYLDSSNLIVTIHGIKALGIGGT